MNDSNEEISKIFFEKIMALTGEERMIAGSKMFDSAREMALASFPSGLSESQIKKMLFERIYGAESR